ncbi:MAG: ribonuclease E/G, partial [Ancalomicrobiaceae bacterium]|nr:ribonuclease E/G [Ancalomicrobiaceae bacterium]
PLFQRFGVEAQLDAMFSPSVNLKSGGYIVINQTEALVSIDVNSGKSTREHNIEDTALATNLEAAEEVSRQLRLRDLAALVVIDFIDMEEKRNNRSVERKLKDCLKNDRARIQVGRISHFGLMEMSRQRIRTGVLESSMVVCQHCGGTGLVRSTESVALHVLRSIEENLIRGVTHDLTVRTRSTVTLYILNQKRAHLFDLEHRFGLAIAILADDHAVMGGHLFTIEKGEPVVARAAPVLQPTQVTPQSVMPDYDETADDSFVEEDETEELEAEAPREARSEPRGEPRRDSEGEAGGRRKRRRRRRGRGRVGDIEGGAPREAAGERNSTPQSEFAAEQPFDGEGDDDSADGDEGEGEGEFEAQGNGDEAGGERGPRKRRRRGRRGGRRNRREGEFGDAESDAGFEADAEGDAADDDAGAGATNDDAGAADLEVVAAEPVEAPVVATPDFVLMDRETLTAEVDVIRAEEAAKPKKPRAPRKPRVTKKAAAEAAAAEQAAADAIAAGDDVAAEAPIEAEAPLEAAPTAAEPVEEVAAEPVASVPPPPPKPDLASTEIDPSKPKRSGWWSRK